MAKMNERELLFYHLEYRDFFLSSDGGIINSTHSITTPPPMVLAVIDALIDR